MTPPPLNTDTDALFLDFDGTLTEIVTRPDDAHLSSERANRLSELAARMQGAVAVLSGRAVSDLDVRLPRALWRVGGHGAELAAPGEHPSPDARRAERARALIEALRPLAAGFDGVQLEEKPTGAALHFRARPEAEATCYDALTAAARQIDGFDIQHGKMVVEARPADVDKGHALEQLNAKGPFAGRRPIMVGDDLTDEPAMRTTQALGGLAIKVGPGKSCADVRLRDPEEVHQWLEAGLMTPQR